MKKKSHSLFKSGLRLSMVTLLSRVLGLVREMTKAAFLGTGSLADAFGIAFQLPNLFRRLFAENSISVAFIPTFRAYIESVKKSDGDGVMCEASDVDVTREVSGVMCESRKITQDFISATLTLVTFLTTIVVLLGILTTPLLIKLFYGKADPESFPEAVFLTRVMFPYLALVSVAAFFQGVLNGENIFAPSGFAPVLFNVVVIVFSYAFSSKVQNPARAMAVGVIAGGFVQMIFQLPFVLKTGWRVSFTSIKSAFTNPGTKKVITLVLPTIIGMAAYQVNDIVSSTLAKRAGVGIYASLQYSLRLQELILGIFAVSIGSVILPDMAGFSKNKDWEKFTSLLTQAIKIIILIALPVTFYSLICGREIISLVYKSKNFTDESVKMTLSVFRFHMVGLSFIALNRILAPAFYAQQNTTLPTAAGIFNFAVNITLAAILVHSMSGAGIAFSLSLASLANTVFLFASMPRLKSVHTKKIVTSFVFYSLKIAFFSVVASIPTYFALPKLVKFFAGYGRFISNGAVVCISSLIFAFLGVVLLFVTKDELLQTLAKRFSH